MKKSLAFISVAVIILSVTLTSCGKPKNIITDDNKATHVIVTNKDGSMKQDAWGNLYEQVTDSNGKAITQAYEYPHIITNKRNTKIENAVLSVQVPDHWSTSGINSILRLRHSGECVKMGESPCQIDFTYQSNMTLDDTYLHYKNRTSNFKAIGSDIGEFNEYETTLFGLKAKALSYKADKSDSTVYYYCVKKDLHVIEITANVYDKCYNSQSIEELLNSCVTLKELGTAPSTTAVTIASSTTTVKTK